MSARSKGRLFVQTSARPPVHILGTLLPADIVALISIHTIITFIIMEEPNSSVLTYMFVCGQVNKYKSTTTYIH